MFDTVNLTFDSQKTIQNISLFGRELTWIYGMKEYSSLFKNVYSWPLDTPSVSLSMMIDDVATTDFFYKLWAAFL